MEKKIDREKCFLDILEQCACLRVMACKGYRYVFYPGSPSASVEYSNQEKQISWKKVFISIEKKVFL